MQKYQGQNATFDFDGNLREGEIDSRTAKVLIKKWGDFTKQNSPRTGRTCGNRNSSYESNP